MLCVVSGKPKAVVEISEDLYAYTRTCRVHCSCTITFKSKDSHADAIEGSMVVVGKDTQLGAAKQTWVVV